MRTLTHNVTEKTLLRLAGRPIARIVIDRILRTLPIFPINITVCVLDRFLEDFKWELRDLSDINFNSSPEALGTLGHYVRATKDFDNNDDVLLYYGDTISTVDLQKMYEFFKKIDSECLIAVTSNLRHDYSAVDFDVNNLVTKMDEKPKMEYPSWTGIAFLKHGLINRYISRIAPDRMDFAKGLFPLLLEDMKMEDKKPRFHAYDEETALYFDTGNISSYLKLMDMAAEGTLNV